MTDTKYEIDDDHEWPDDNPDHDDPTYPNAAIEHHTITVRDRRGPDEDDMRYRYVFRDGIAIGIQREHQLSPSKQFDYAGPIGPFQVPGRCRQLLADELGADHWCDVVDIDSTQAHADRRP